MQQNYRELQKYEEATIEEGKEEAEQREEKEDKEKVGRKYRKYLGVFNHYHLNVSGNSLAFT